MIVFARSRQFHTSAFTFVQTLAVLTIIVILTAIVLPIYLSAKARAKSVSCMSNQRQVSEALLIYAVDHDDVFAASRSIKEGYWMKQLAPYAVRNELSCPSFISNYRSGPAPYDAVLTGYAINGCLGDSAPVRPSTVILLSEVADIVVGRSSGESAELSVVSIARPDCIEYSEANLHANGLSYRGGPFGSLRHGAGSNYAIADGHSVWKRPSEVAFISSNNPCSLVLVNRWRAVGKIVNSSSSIGYPNISWEVEK